MSERKSIEQERRSKTRTSPKERREDLSAADVINAPPTEESRQKGTDITRTQKETLAAALEAGKKAYAEAMARQPGESAEKLDNLAEGDVGSSGKELSAIPSSDSPTIPPLDEKTPHSWTPRPLRIMKGGVFIEYSVVTVPKSDVEFLKHTEGTPMETQQRVKQDGENEQSFFYSRNLEDVELLSGRPGPVKAEGYLDYAASTHDWELMKSCISWGVNTKFSNSSALRSAAANGHTDMVKFLVEKGADPHALDDLALVEAVEYGKKETARFLLSIGPSEKGLREAYARAIKNRHDDVADLLDEALHRNARQSPPQP